MVGYIKDKMLMASIRLRMTGQTHQGKASNNFMDQRTSSLSILGSKDPWLRTSIMSFLRPYRSKSKPKQSYDHGTYNRFVSGPEDNFFVLLSTNGSHVRNKGLMGRGTTYWSMLKHFRTFRCTRIQSF